MNGKTFLKWLARFLWFEILYHFFPMILKFHFYYASYICVHIHTWTFILWTKILGWFIDYSLFYREGNWDAEISSNLPSDTLEVVEQDTKPRSLDLDSVVLMSTLSKIRTCVWACFRTLFCFFTLFVYFCTSIS